MGQLPSLADMKSLKKAKIGTQGQQFKHFDSTAIEKNCNWNVLHALNAIAEHKYVGLQT